MKVRDHHLDDGIFARSWNTGGDRWCVLLHDSLGCVELWRDFPEKLAGFSGLNVFAYDRPGYGRSRDPSSPRGIDFHAVEGRVGLPGVLRSAGIARTSIVGHSDGASIALFFAAAYPDQLDSLVVYGAHMDVDQVTRQGLEKVRGDVGNARQKIKKLERFHGKRARQLYQQWFDIWLDGEFARTYNLAPILHHISCPCFIFQGEKDEYAAPDHPFRIRRAIGRNAQAMIIRRMAHLPHIEHPDLTLGLILAHLPLQGGIGYANQ